MYILRKAKIVLPTLKSCDFFPKKYFLAVNVNTVKCAQYYTVWNFLNFSSLFYVKIIFDIVVVQKLPF